MRTRMRVLLMVAPALALGSLGTAPALAAHHETRLTTTLSWQNEVDTGSDMGYGFAAVRLTEDRACFGTRWTNISTPTMAHIHVGPEGVAGPVVVPLFMEGPGPNSSDHSAWGCVDVDPALAEMIAMHPEDYYVNVHTPEFPAGAIRGQLSMPMD